MSPARATLSLFSLILGTTSSMAADSAWFDSDGLQLRYLSEGDGTPVVLLHGFSGSAEGLYREPGTMTALANAGFRAIALDQRGHGKSDKPHDPAMYGPAMPEDVRRLLDHLGIEKAHLIGYSMGAKVANGFRTAYPERLLTLTLGGYGWPWQSRTSASYEEARQRINERTVLPGNDLDALAAVSMRTNELTPSAAELAANKIATLAIIGDKDEVISKQNLDTLIATMANLEVVVIPGTHAGPDGAPYKPRFAAELVAFLKRHASQ